MYAADSAFEPSSEIIAPAVYDPTVALTSAGQEPIRGLPLI
jgi:hypothetical protein